MCRCCLITLLSWLSVTFVALAQPVSLNSPNSVYQQDFDTLVSSGSSNVVPAGWTFSESGSGTANNGLYTTGTGSNNSGDTYSFGASGSAERAFGTLRSGSLVSIIGAEFINNTGTTLTSFKIQYHGEQWRLGTLNRADRLDFQWSLDATSITIGTWNDVDDLDFISPVNAGTVGALNGNANSTIISVIIPGLNISNGQTFFIRWLDVDAASADDGLAIDDFSLILNPSESAISFSPAPLNFGDVNAGDSKTLTYEVITLNLEDPVTISVSDSAFQLSADDVTFFSSATIPKEGGLVYVRFSPISNGLIETAINHSSRDYNKALPLTGFGYEQASNIISIASARAKPVGTKVTVAGRITIANELGNPACLQDESGGIPVFDFLLAGSVQIGDSVLVTGPIGVLNEQKQISGSEIFFTKADATPRDVPPKWIQINALAAHEGLLVTVQNVELVNKNFVFYPQSPEYITDGTIQADLRIDGDTDIPGLVKPQGTINITGVAGRFNTNAQLLPRFRKDIPGAEEPVAPTDTIAKNKTLDIVNWNLEFFGAKKEDYQNNEFGPEDELLQLQNIKQVLDSLNADIIAVQEVTDEAFFAGLVAHLEHYDYACSQRFSYSFREPGSTFPPQKVCFIYDTRTVINVKTRVLFENLFDSARTIDPSLLPDYPTGDLQSFYSGGRLPYLLTANATIEGVMERILLINLHAKSGATTEDRNRRAYDADVLHDTLAAHYPDEQLIILGDLNDDLDQSIMVGYQTPYAGFVGDTENYLAVTKTLTDAGARSTINFSDVIDHQIISKALVEEYVNGSAQIITPFRYIRNYGNTTSDHLPVITRFTFQAPPISDKTRRPKFEVYPNPTNGAVKLVSDQLEEGENIYAEVYNSYGKRLFAGNAPFEELDEKITTILRENCKGLYLLKLFADNESYVVRVINN